MAAVRYRNEVKQLKCEIEGKGEGAVESVKDVLSHIMSKSGLQSEARNVSSNLFVFL